MHAATLASQEPPTQRAVLEVDASATKASPPIIIGRSGRVSAIETQLWLTVKEKPGIHFRGLGRACGITSAGQLRHHVDSLVRMGHLHEVKDGRFSRYFVSGDHEPNLRPSLARFSRPVPRMIGKLLLSSPMTRTELRRRIGCADSTLGYNLNRMLQHGDVEKRPLRKTTLYAVTDPNVVRRALLAESVVSTSRASGGEAQEHRLPSGEQAAVSPAPQATVATPAAPAAPSAAPAPVHSSAPAPAPATVPAPAPAPAPQPVQAPAAPTHAPAAAPQPSAPVDETQAVAPAPDPSQQAAASAAASVDAAPSATPPTPAHSPVARLSVPMRGGRPLQRPLPNRPPLPAARAYAAARDAGKSGTDPTDCQPRPPADGSLPNRLAMAA